MRTREWAEVCVQACVLPVKEAPTEREESSSPTQLSTADTQPPPLQSHHLCLTLSSPPQLPPHPYTFGQSQTDVIAKVAEGCYIPEAVVARCAEASFGNLAKLGWQRRPCHLAADSTPRTVGPRPTSAGHPGTKLT